MRRLSCGSWEMSAVPSSCDTTNLPRDKAGCWLLLVDPALSRGTQCPIHGCCVQLSTDLAGSSAKKTCFPSETWILNPSHLLEQLCLVHRGKAEELGWAVGSELGWESPAGASLMPWSGCLKERLDKIKRIKE